MAEEFEDQGGVAGMDPPSLQRWLTSAVMRRMVRPAALAKRRARAEKARRREGRPHRVEYFHQVDDGYSHLAA
ncbi:MAG: 2-hydroxychromene-2-carboxylate isomerase, partial [Myxococcota bacterium]